MAPGPKRRGARRENANITAPSNRQPSSRTVHDDSTKVAHPNVGVPFTADSNLISDTTTDGPIENETGKKYTKRSITSNWDRYNDESAPVAQPAPDFHEVLLNSSGGAGSQFCFQEEKKWSETLKDSIDDALSLDINELGKTLQCIPLHKRLGIDRERFMPEQTARFEEASKSLKRIYKGTRKWPFLVFEDEEANCPQVPTSQIVKSLAVIKKEPPVPKPVSADTSVAINLNIADKDKIKADVMSPFPALKPSDKDELEFLLTLGSFPQATDKSFIDQNQGKDVNTKTVPNSRDTTEAKVEPSLDEWLDSVLEN